MNTTSACYAVLRLFWGIRRSVPRTVFQSLVSCPVLPRLDYCNAVLAGILLYLALRLQSVTDECGRTACLRVTKVRSHHAAPTPITLAESSMADRLQAGSSGLQMSSWPGIVIPR